MFFEGAEHFTGFYLPLLRILTRFVIMLINYLVKEKNWKSKLRHSTIDDKDNIQQNIQNFICPEGK